MGEKVELDQELKEILSEIGPLKDKLNKLEQEIKSDPNVDLLEEIIFSGKRTVSNEKNEYEDITAIIHPFFGINLIQIVRTIIKIMNR